MEVTIGKVIEYTFTFHNKYRVGGVDLMEKRKHKPFILFLCLIICGFLILGPIYFIEYGYKRNDKLQEDKKANWTGVITLWDYPRLDNTNGTRYGWITSKIKEFEKANPGVYIELKPLDWKKGPIELETAIMTKTFPDIAPVGSDYSIITQDVLEPLEQYFSEAELNNYKANALMSVRHNGSIWGVPWMMTTYTMFLNLDLFNERGVMPPKNGNWTYEEFVEAMKALTYDKDDDGENDLFGFHSFIGLNDYNTWGILLSDGAEIFSPDGSTYMFNDEKAAKGLKKLTDLKLIHNVTPENFGENSEQEAWDLFSRQKKVAVYPTGTWAINVLNDLRYQGGGFEFGVANYPVGARGVPVPMARSTSAYGIFKQDNQEKVEMCMKFLKFITQDEYQKELDKLGVFPVKKSVGAIYGTDPIMGLIEKSLAYTYTIPANPHWLTIDGLLQSQIRQVLLEQKNIEDALDDAEVKIQLYMNAHEKMPNDEEIDE